MKQYAVALLTFLAVVGAWNSFHIENDQGRLRAIWFKTGDCKQTRAVEGHAAYGRLYPVALEWGTLVSPGMEPGYRGSGNVWMCYAHASEWIKNPK